ncbi:hypothetical protein H0H93_005826 [Arthromyces matolae]|nr:hypothetical protein H0H93_005826 [Arthromyces matolae]
MASFLSIPESTTSPVLKFAQTSTPLTTSMITEDDPSLKYYTCLRGLNVSLLVALNKATEEDPFADISDTLDRYRSLRLDVQKEFEDSSKKPTPPAAPEKLAFAPPVPPSGAFSGFGGFGNSTSSSFTLSTKQSDDKPAPSLSLPVAPSSAFSFLTPSVTAPSSAFKATTNPGSVPSFAPATSSLHPFAKTEAGSQASSSTTSPFGSTVTGFGSIPKPDAGSDDGSALSAFAKESKPPPGPFTFAASTAPSGKDQTSSIFGVSSTSLEKAPSLPFSFKPISAETASSSSMHKSSASSDENASSSPSFALPSASSPFSFGKSATTPPTGFGISTSNNGFSSPGIFSMTTKASPFGSVDKPVFSPGTFSNPGGFIAPFSAKIQELPGTAAESSSSVEKNEDEAPEGSQTGSVTSEGSLGLVTKNPHDEEGQGEENEDTIHESRVKIFRLDAKEEKSSWTDLGVGLKPTQTKKTIALVGHDEKGASQTYSARLADEASATTLREVLEKEVASLMTSE